jgi:hypothetical protein
MAAAPAPPIVAEEEEEGMDELTVSKRRNSVTLLQGDEAWDIPLIALNAKILVYCFRTVPLFNMPTRPSRMRLSFFINSFHCHAKSCTYLPTISSSLACTFLPGSTHEPLGVWAKVHASFQRSMFLLRATIDLGLRAYQVSDWHRMHASTFINIADCGDDMKND